MGLAVTLEFNRAYPLHALNPSMRRVFDVSSNQTALVQGWAASGTRAELGTRALLSGT